MRETQPEAISPLAQVNGNSLMATTTQARTLHKHNSMPSGRHLDHEWEPQRPIPRSSSSRAKSTHRLMNGPALRRVESASASSASGQGHHRPRPISTGRIVTRSFRDGSTSQVTPPPPPPPQRSSHEPPPQQSRPSHEPQQSRPSHEPQPLRPSHEEPSSVTRAILDLREKREQAQSRRIHRESVKKYPLHQQRAQSLVDSGSASAAMSPNEVEHKRERALEHEEAQATQRLKHAENKISSLMEELDELRFFHEIEAASPSPNSKNGTNRYTPPASPIPRKKPMEKLTRTLSPRRLSSLDRTSLELEAQQLQRQVEILEREKASLEATVEMCEMAAASHEEDRQRMHLLEKALQNVQQELLLQLQEVQTGRMKLTKEYEDKIALLQQDYQSTKDAADELLLRLGQTQKGLEHLENRHLQAKEEARKMLDDKTKAWEEIEDKLHKQLEEIETNLELVTQSLQDRDEQVSKLQHELDLTHKALETNKGDKDHSYELKLEALEKQLSEVRDQHASLRAEHDKMQQTLQQKDEDLAKSKVSEQEHRDRLTELQSQLNQMMSTHETDMENLKKTFGDREKRRLDDLVLLQQDGNEEYERRLKSLQEQLILATDRHQYEMEQKDAEFRVKLERQVDAARQEVREEFEPIMKSTKEELALVQVKYEQAKEQNLRREVQSESKDRDTAREWERKEALRQAELDRMNGRLDRTARELAEKDSKIESLQEKLSETEQRNNSVYRDLEARHSDELAARDELMENHRKMSKASEVKLRTELARKDSELMAIRELMDSSAEELRVELDQTRKELAEAKKDARDDEQLRQKVAIMQASMEKAQTDFIMEQARHEGMEAELRMEIAKLEGKLSATESTLKEKRSQIEELEQRLTNVDEESSAKGSKLQQLISSLKRDLDASRELLLKEKSEAEEKDKRLTEFEEERKLYAAKLEKMSELEETATFLRRALDEVQEEKESQVNELVKIQEEQEKAAKRILDTEKQLTQDKERMSKDLVRKEKQMEEAVEKHNITITELNNKLAEQDLAKTELKSEIERLKASLKDANEMSRSRNSDAADLQDRIVALEEKIDEQRKVLAQKETRADESVKTLKEQLADAEKAQAEVGDKLDRVMSEKAEVVEALEQMLHEVQSREEEVDALTDILNTRDEELEHAKLIATKAIASAQEIKSRYKEKGVRESDRQADFQLKIDELSASLDYLSGKNDQLQSKAYRLESELRDKNMECARLKDMIRENTMQSANDYKQVDKSGFAPLDVVNNAFSPVEASAMGRKKGFQRMDFASFDDQHSDVSLMLDSMSTNTADLGEATKWLEDFDSDNKSGFHSLDEARSEPGTKSRRSIEKDALRKYVRKRYLKRPPDHS